METKTHFFFALTLPIEMKETLHKQTEQLKKEFPFKKWLHYEDYHITLAFLGNASEDMRLDATEQVVQALRDEACFSLSLEDLGVFGPQVKPRILWAGVSRQERLMVIQKKVFEACQNAGFSLDNKSFKPHITLARKYMEEAFNINHLQEHVDNISRERQYTASHVTLYQTHLGESPAYEPIFSILLK